MIVCNRCGKENQDHYKFCLGCGADISAAPKASDVGMMKTMMAEGSSAPRPLPGAPPMSAPRAAATSRPGGMPPAGVISTMPPTTGPAAPTAPPIGPPMAAAPMGPPPGVPGFAAPISAAKACPACGTDVPPSFRFCGSCGYRMGDASAPAPMPVAPAPVVMAPAAAPAPVFTMTLIRPDGTEGGMHELKLGSNHIGRNTGGVFETDGYLSPIHAELFINPASGNVTSSMVRDLGSLNGVFVRMTEERELLPGQIVRIGQELLRLELITPPDITADGTEVMGSPNPGYWGRLVVIVGAQVDGAAHPLLGESVTLGRERGEINFPDDGYVSGLHARISYRDGRVFLADLGSSNGTFLKVNGEAPIGHESFVLLGQQLFRLAIPG